MPEAVDFKKEYAEAEAAMTKAVDHFSQEMNNVRAGRANPRILDKIVVDYYGTPTPLRDMANISVPEARMIVISLWDSSAIKDVNKAIMASDLGVTPADDGKVIRLNFPVLTEERRKEIVKTIKKTAEDSKVALRNCRRDVMETFKRYKKDNLISEDGLSQAEKEIQKITDKYTANIESQLSKKEKEVLEI
jgi:ribosome recycling factor